MVEDWILKWFEKNGKIEREALEKEVSYIDAGYVDSFGFIGLISESEEKFGINFTDDDFSKEEIFTIAGIIKIIQKKRGNV